MATATRSASPYRMDEPADRLADPYHSAATASRSPNLPCSRALASATASANSRGLFSSCRGPSVEGSTLRGAPRAVPGPEDGPFGSLKPWGPLCRLNYENRGEAFNLRRGQLHRLQVPDVALHVPRLQRPRDLQADEPWELISRHRGAPRPMGPIDREGRTKLQQALPQQGFSRAWSRIDTSRSRCATSSKNICPASTLAT